MSWSHPRWTITTELLTKPSRLGHIVLRTLATMVPFVWQRNKAIFFYFTQNSAFEIYFGVGVQRLDSASDPIWSHFASETRGHCACVTDPLDLWPSSEAAPETGMNEYLCHCHILKSPHSCHFHKSQWRPWTTHTSKNKIERRNLINVKELHMQDKLWGDQIWNYNFGLVSF